MASLLDTIKQNSAALSASTPASNPLLSATGMQPTTGEETEATASLMATAQTGKELGAGTAPRLSALSERLASLNTLNQAKDLSRQAQLQGISFDQQADALQQQQQQALTQLNENQINASSQFNQQVKGMLFEQQTQLKQLDLSKDKSRMEQMGFMLRLGNQQYIDQLQTEGARARLDNAVSFNEALQRSIFADEVELLSSSLEFRNYLMADAREAQRQLADMDIEFAMQIAASENKAASAQMMWSGIGTVVGKGAAYAAGASKSTPEAAPTGNIPQDSGSAIGPLDTAVV